MTTMTYQAWRRGARFGNGSANGVLHGSYRAAPSENALEVDRMWYGRSESLVCRPRIWRTLSCSLISLDRSGYARRANSRGVEGMAENEQDHEPVNRV